mmetsp:Transcript_90924/g.266233  ORF Transcript_90924/g.266233 Transcript_90924/m.266233 type:complete len:224 (-) Transcript_90924:219-890(-)
MSAAHPLASTLRVEDVAAGQPHCAVLRDEVLEADGALRVAPFHAAARQLTVLDRLDELHVWEDLAVSMAAADGRRDGALRGDEDVHPRDRGEVGRGEALGARPEEDGQAEERTGPGHGRDAPSPGADPPPVRGDAAPGGDRSQVVRQPSRAADEDRGQKPHDHVLQPRERRGQEQEVQRLLRDLLPALGVGALSVHDDDQHRPADHLGDALRAVHVPAAGGPV